MSEAEKQELEEELLLSQSKDVGTSTRKESAVRDKWEVYDIEECALSEAIRKSIQDMQEKSIATPSIFVCSEEGDYVLSQQELDMVRENLVALSQDIGEILNLHHAIAIFCQEQLGEQEIEKSKQEAKERAAKEKKKKELKEEMKKKGKEKVEKSPVPLEQTKEASLEHIAALLLKLRENNAAIHLDLQSQIQEEEELDVWTRIEDEQEAIERIKINFEDEGDNHKRALQEDQEFCKEVAKELGNAHDNVVNLKALVVGRRRITFKLLADGQELLSLMEQLEQQNREGSNLMA